MKVYTDVEDKDANYEHDVAQALMLRNKEAQRAEQAEARVAELHAIIAILLPHLEATVEASHLTDGFYKKRNKYDEILESVLMKEVGNAKKVE